MYKTLDLVVFVDAFGWEILGRNSSFLKEKLPHRYPLKTVFGYSSTCIPTILTGVMPQEHGHFSFFYYNPAKSPFKVMKYFKYLPSSVTRRGRVRRYMSRFIKKLYGFTGYFQIYNMPFEYLELFDYSEKKDLYKSGGINSGSETIFDLLEAKGIPYSLSDWSKSEVSNLHKVKEDIKNQNPRVAYVYLADLDGVLHQYGTESKHVTNKIAWYDNQLRNLFDEAEKNYKEVRITVFSDHGQADIHTIYDLIPKIDQLGLTFGVDYVAVYDSTMARFWFFKEDAREKVNNFLSKEKHGKILSIEQLKKLGCAFEGNKFGEMFFLVDPGVLICPSFLGEKPLAGMHGYHPSDKDSIAMIMSNYSFKDRPKRLDDMRSYIFKMAQE